MKINKVSLGLIVLVVIFGLILSSSPILAAAPTGTLTGTVITVNIGQIKAIDQLTITAPATTTDILATNDICIRIPAGVNAEWDIADTSPTFEGTESAKVTSSVTYPTNKILKIDVTTDFATSGTLTIADLSYIGVTATSAGAALEWAVDNTACSAATYGTADANTALTVADGVEDTLISITATPANPASGVTTNYTIAFTVPTNGVIPKAGKILVDFPDDFGVSGVAFGSHTGIDGTYTITTATGAVVTLTRNNDGTNSSASSKQIVLNDIVNSTTVGTNKALSVTTQTSVPNQLATGNSANFTIDPYPISNLACVPSGSAGAVYLTWTVPQLNPTGYLVKYSTAGIATDAEFNAATTYTQSWTAGTAGSGKQELVSGLNPNLRYYFNIKATAAGNALSLISNLATCFSPAGGGIAAETKAPTSSILDPVDGATILAGKSYTVKGTSSDTGGSSVQKVELSLDGGTTWVIVTAKAMNNLSGFDWEYVWPSPSVGAFNLKTKATDWVLNKETPGAGITVKVATELPTEKPPVIEKPIPEMTIEELKAKITEIQQKIIELLQQLIQLIQSQITEL